MATLASTRFKTFNAMGRHRHLITPIGICFLITQILFSCNNEDEGNKVQNVAATVHNDQPEAIVKDYNTWVDYNNKHINFSQDFVGLDADSRKMTKEAFLNLLTTGKYVPLKVNDGATIPSYKLSRFQSNNPDISAVIKQLAGEELTNYKKEGRELPEYNWKDLKGNRYTKESTKGKILVLKCWFIHCVACVREFPELNELVTENKNKKDLEFVSLAMDSRRSLADFIKKKPFLYAVVPVSEQFMVDTLNVRLFPTHIIVGKNGRIAHVVGNFKDLEYALKKEVAKG